MDSLPRHLSPIPSRTTADDDDAFYRQDIPWRDVEAFRQNQGRLNIAPHDTNIVIRISNNNDGTGQAIIIGMLSAVGSAMALVIIFAVVYFFRYTSRGRIFLDRIGRPGEYDDEQALAKEEADALEDMDDLQRTEYMRAKGGYTPLRELRCVAMIEMALIKYSCSIHTSQPARNITDGHFTLAVSRHSREGRFCLGVRTRT